MNEYYIFALQISADICKFHQKNNQMLTLPKEGLGIKMLSKNCKYWQNYEVEKLEKIITVIVEHKMRRRLLEI